MDVAKQLNFSLEAGAVAHMMQAQAQWRDDTSDDVRGASIANKLAELNMSLETLMHSVDGHSADTASAAQQRMQGVCSDQMLKRQLQSLKASFINLGQKESFAEAIKSFFRSTDFKPEADRAAGAVESAEEDLKDLKKINQQDEEQLRHLVQTVSSYHDQYQSVVARVAQRMALSTREWEAYEASKQPSAASAADKEVEAEQEAALAQEGARASRLESEIVATQAECADTEAALQAQLDDVAVLRAEAEQLQAVQEDQVKEADSHLQRSNQWCEEMLEVMSRTTGLSLVSIEQDCVHVMLRQEVPLALDAGAEGGGEERTLEHTLSMHLAPSSSRLEYATLAPESCDITREVELAKWQHGSLPLLVSAVRGRLYTHWRRQFQIEEASKLHSLSEVPGRPSLLRAVLLGGQQEAEAEVDVPLGWPDSKQPLRLCALRSLGGVAPGTDIMPAPAALAQLHAAAGRKTGLPRFLAAVTEAVPPPAAVGRVCRSPAVRAAGSAVAAC